MIMSILGLLFFRAQVGHIRPCNLAVCGPFVRIRSLPVHANHGTQIEVENVEGAASWSRSQRFRSTPPP
jgi:hypothetical protein